MRAARLDEVLRAAGCLKTLPDASQPGQAAQWITDCHFADKYRKRLGKNHAEWGNGSLLARVGPTCILGQTDLGDPDYLQAVITILSALLAWQTNPLRR